MLIRVCADVPYHFGPQLHAAMASYFIHVVQRYNQLAAVLGKMRNTRDPYLHCKMTVTTFPNVAAGIEADYADDELHKA